MYKQMIQSFLPLIIVIFLFALVGNFSISKISDVRQELATSQNQKTTLNQKLTLLSGISEIVADGSDASLNALPESNTTLVEFSQLKSLALQDGVSLASVKSNTPVAIESNIFSSDIAFDVTGNTSQVVNFLKGMEKLAPLTNVSKLKFTSNQNEITVNVTIKTFWSALPKTIPQVTDMTADLTNDEKKMLTTVKTLVQPQFTTVPANDTAGKSDPFSQ